MSLRGTGIILAVMSELELLVDTGVYMPAPALDPIPLSGLMAPVTPVQYQSVFPVTPTVTFRMPILRSQCSGRS